MLFHGTKFKPRRRARSTARALSGVETVPRNSGCRAACHAGQKPERKFTLTPGNSAASHSATGCQQHSTCPGISKMADDQFAVFIGPKQVFPHDADVIGNFGQPPRAGIIAEFEIRQPDIKHSIQQFARLRRPVRVGFPNQLCVVRQRGNDLQNRRQMNRRLAAEDHHRACAVGERGAGPFNQFFQSHRLARRADSSSARP